MLTSIATATWLARPGDIVEMNDEREAVRLVKAGYAVEAAVVRPPENAAKKPPKGRVRK